MGIVSAALSMSISCSKSKMLKGLDDPYNLLEKTVFTSKWKRFTINHPSGFWQVIKKERWTLLYNNQDAPVQMVVDANRHFLGMPDEEKRIKSFLKKFKAANTGPLLLEKTTIEGIEALKTVVKTNIMFDFWDKFYVERTLEIYAFNKNKCSYLFAFIADEQNFEKYYPGFTTLIGNFRTLDPKAKGPAAQHSP